MGYTMQALFIRIDLDGFITTISETRQMEKLGSHMTVSVFILPPKASWLWEKSQLISQFLDLCCLAFNIDFGKINLFTFLCPSHSCPLNLIRAKPRSPISFAMTLDHHAVFSSSATNSIFGIFTMVSRYSKHNLESLRVKASLRHQLCSAVK
nr:hypothetical protein Iba_chr02dCG9470 [Ipomoea batatas]